MTKTLFVLNDAPYGSEGTYNALRLAGALARRENETVKLFLLGDAASSAKAGQNVPRGYYNVAAMLRAAADQGAEIGVCGTCLGARGLTGAELVPGAAASTLEQLTDWTVWADKVLVF